MNRANQLLTLLAGVLLSTPGAFAQQTNPESVPPGTTYSGRVSAVNNDIGEILPSTVIYNANVVAAGVGLRQREFGCIDTHGIPDNAQIVGAYLYWAYIAPTYIPGVHDVMDFRRFRPGPQYIQENFIWGDLCGMGGDPCWFHPGSHFTWVFRADVTQWILGNAEGNPKRNGAYFVRAHPNAQGNPNFGDPWRGAPVSPLLEGATLVIAYRVSGQSNGTVYLYDDAVGPFNKALCGNMFNGCEGIRYQLGDFFARQQVCGKFIQIGADGQSAGAGGRGGCDADEEFSIERTKVAIPNSGNYMVVSGLGSEYYNSDWNGMDGNCLPQLWDTACHDISPIFSSSGASVTALDVQIQNYTCDGPCTGGPSDCLVTVANVLHICD